MKTVQIFLKGIEDVKNFVDTLNKFTFDVDLISGRYAVDAKSIMGIFSLDLSKTVTLQAHTEDTDEFFAAIKEFIVED